MNKIELIFFRVIYVKWKTLIKNITFCRFFFKPSHFILCPMVKKYVCIHNFVLCMFIKRTVFAVKSMLCMLCYELHIVVYVGTCIIHVLCILYMYNTYILCRIELACIVLMVWLCDFILSFWFISNLYMKFCYFSDSV